MVLPRSNTEDVKSLRSLVPTVQLSNLVRIEGFDGSDL